MAVWWLLYDCVRGFFHGPPPPLQVVKELRFEHDAAEEILQLIMVLADMERSAEHFSADVQLVVNETVLRQLQIAARSRAAHVRLPRPSGPDLSVTSHPANFFEIDLDRPSANRARGGRPTSWARRTDRLGRSRREGGSHTPRRVNTMMKLFH